MLIPATVASIPVRLEPSPENDDAVTTPVTLIPPVALTFTKDPDVNEGVSDRVIVAVAPRATAVAVILLLTKLSCEILFAVPTNLPSSLTVIPSMDPTPAESTDPHYHPPDPSAMGTKFADPKSVASGDNPSTSNL